MSQLPSPLRAVIGLAAEAAEQARQLPATLPNKALELPMLAVSTALQLSMRAQQRYAMLAARGDAILNHQEASDEPPPWATFDDPVPDTASDPAPDDLTPGTDEPGGDRGAAGRGIADVTELPVAPDASDNGAAPQKRTGPAKKTTPRKGTANGATAGKSVPPPRRGAPSRFDTVGDD